MIMASMISLYDFLFVISGNRSPQFYLSSFRRRCRRKFFKVKVVSVTSSGRRATLTGGFDFQHEVFYK